MEIMSVETMEEIKKKYDAAGKMFFKIVNKDTNSHLRVVEEGKEIRVDAARQGLKLDKQGRKEC